MKSESTEHLNVTAQQFNLVLMCQVVKQCTARELCESKVSLFPLGCEESVLKDGTIPALFGPSCSSESQPVSNIKH